MSWRRLGLLGGGAVAVALFLGWQSGQVTVPPDPPSARTNWTLAAQPADDIAKELTLLKERKPWTNDFPGASGGHKPNKEPPPPARWRLAGVVERPDGNFALIAVGNPPTNYEYRAVGDKLPDGTTLVEISHDAVTARSDKAEEEALVYRLFDGPAKPRPPAAPAPPEKRAELSPPRPPMSTTGEHARHHSPR